MRDVNVSIKLSIEDTCSNEEFSDKISTVIENIQYVNSIYEVTTSEDITYVIFYKDKEYGRILAVFPEEVRQDGAYELITCYAHIGQHSECVQDFLDKDCVLATEDEYSGLLEELKSIGYNVSIVDVNKKVKTVPQREFFEYIMQGYIVCSDRDADAKYSCTIRQDVGAGIKDYLVYIKRSNK